VLAVIRLSASIAPRLAATTGGTIINISSVTALMPRSFAPVYTATKAFVLSFSESLQAELGGSGVRIQAVLPGITRTAICDAERIATVPAGMVMDVNEMVDAALSGFDLGETITIPSLEDTATFDAFLAARDALAPGLSLNQPATRYGADTQEA
jgi:short-subunit dehydrogenase